MLAKVQVFLHVGRIQHGDTGGGENVIGLVGHRGGFGAVVIACQYQHTAVTGAAGRVGMLEHVHGTVHTRAFAIPHGKGAIEAGTGVQIGLLATPDGGSGQIFVQTGLEYDVVFLQVFAGLP